MRWKKLTAAVIGFMLLLNNAITTWGKEETVLVNTLQTGGVKIQLSRLMVGEDGSLKSWCKPDTILPGDKVSLIPQVTVLKEPCYIRLKYGFQDEETEEILRDTVFGIDDNWLYCEDGYYYYTHILSNGDHVEFFHGFCLPEDFPQSLEGMDMIVSFQVDALQSKNFTPDFQSASPWGNVQILDAVEGENSTLTACNILERSPLSIIYQGDSKKLVANQEDFFAGFSTFMPGDVCQDTAVIRNDSQEKLSLYFSQKCSLPTDLLEQMKLTIAWMKGDDKTEIFSGSLAKQAENILLAKLEENDSGTLTFTIEMPADLDNDYSWLQDGIQWIFSTNTIEAAQKTDSLKTGDDQNVNAYLLTGGLALASLCLIVGQKERRKKLEKN